MRFCLRIDLDYVPWDEPDAREFGHGEPAMILRLLTLARTTGAKMHFFASDRVLRAFPQAAEAALSEGHHVDWFCKHPDQMVKRLPIARAALGELGSPLRGFALRNAWPEGEPVPPEAAALQFATGPVSGGPPGLPYFPVNYRPEREAIRSGQSVRVWCDAVRQVMRERASLQQDVVIALRPQVLAKADPQLRLVREIMELAKVIGLQQRTLIEMLAEIPK